MNKDSKDFLFKLLHTPSPSGQEQKIQRVIASHMKPYADSIETDLHGNLMVGINPKAELRIMLAGHCDQIGMMVKFITEDGFILVTPIGGVDPGVLPGSHVTIHSESGAIPGIIGRKPYHLQSVEEREKGKVDFDKIWIDIGAANKRAAQKLISLGDTVTFKAGVTELPNSLITSPALDDKVGVFIAMEALRRVSKKKLSVGLFAVSTVQEELGARGVKTSTFSIEPTVGIAIDVTHANDNPGNENRRGPSVHLGAGPCISKGPNTNPVVGSLLVKAAQKNKIPFQILPNPGVLSNDTREMQITGKGVATACIGIPNRYMHTQVEVCNLSDIDNAADLLATFILSVTPRTSFKPGV